jgi:hypothetical protein
MKNRQKKVLVVMGLGLFGYFASYFTFVRTELLESHDQVIPTPLYRPFDGDFVQTAFGLAHLIDSTYIRPAHWEPRSAERKHSQAQP